MYNQQESVQQEAGKAVHQFRKQYCADWYDGRADHGDSGGPYEERTLYTVPQPTAQGDALDAERWRMAALVGNEVMVHPDKRNHAAAVAAYMQAVSSGLDLTAAIDAARAAQKGKKP